MYKVTVAGHPSVTYEDAHQAIDYIKTQFYVAPSTRKNVLKQLEKNSRAYLNYGFSSAVIEVVAVT